MFVSDLYMLSIPADSLILIFPGFNVSDLSVCSQLLKYYIKI